MIESFPLSPIFLPSVLLAEHKTLPRISAVYFALSESGEPLYIGATQNLRQRWNKHNQIDRLRDLGFASIAYYSCPYDKLAETEYAMILQFKPPLNAPSFQRYVKPFFSKESITVNLSTEALRLLESMAFSLGVHLTTVLEVAIREKAKREQVD